MKVFNLRHFYIIIFNMMVGATRTKCVTVYDTNTTLKSLIINHSGHVLTGGDNGLFQFSNDGIEQKKTEHALDTNCMDESCRNDSQTVTRGISIFMIYKPDETNEFVLFCGSYNRSCFLHNSTNISQFWPFVGQPAGRFSSALAVHLPNTYQIYLATDTRDYSGFNNGTDDVGMFSEKLIDWDSREKKPYLYFNSDEYPTHIKAKTSSDGFYFVKGFLHRDYVYFLQNTRNGKETAFISQMCTHDQHFRNYAESAISCNGYTWIVTASLFYAANKTYLVAIFHNIPKRPSGSALCMYDMATLQNRFKDIKDKCFYNTSGAWPAWIDGSPGDTCKQKITRKSIYCGESSANTRIQATDVIQQKPGYAGSAGVMTSVNMPSVNRTSSMKIHTGYIGYEDGYIEKVVFNQSNVKQRTIFRTNINEPSLQQSPSTGPIQNLALSDDGTKLYFTQGTKVGMLRTDDCNLFSECFGCLADMTSCLWSVSSNNGSGKCIYNSAFIPGNVTYTNHCPPRIHTISPTAGPISGGTLLKIGGNFSYLPSNTRSIPQVQARVFIGRYECIVKMASPNRLECVTRAANTTQYSGKITVEVQATSVKLDRNLYLNDVKCRGNTSSNHWFDFKKPYVNAGPDESITMKQTGQVQITLTGAHLDIGSDRGVAIGKQNCSIDAVTNTSISCRAPAQDATGTYKAEVTIDGAVISGPNITYIPDPVIEKIQPLKIIKSGGISLTLSGKRFEGIGKTVYLVLSEGFRQNITNEHSCDVETDRIVCLTGNLNTIPDLPEHVIAKLYTTYGTIAATSTEPNIANLTVVRDPEVKNLSETLFLRMDRRAIFHFEGKSLKNVDKREIHISIGPRQCPITQIDDVGMICRLESKTDNVKNDVHDVTVTIGNLEYNVGNAIFRSEYTQTTSSKLDLGDNVSVIVVSVMLGIAVVAAVTIVATKMRMRKIRSKRDDPYNVTFRRGSDILTLDGLSENHATDVSQNRQNAYYEQSETFTKSSDDNTHAKETDCLLPAIDDETRACLEQHRLLIDKNCLVLGEVIGQGHFGCVYKGYKRLPDEKQETLVAAKTLQRSNPKELDVQMFFKEALIMKDFHHRNVMELIGICIGLDNLPLVVLPYMRRGDLLMYLRDGSNVPTVKDLVVFGVDVANGMHYLSQLKFIHRDLAARNCMIDDDLTVKVADFGLSRDVYEKEYYSSCDKTTKLPVKWMSPESLEFGMYGSKSDVWSYGVVLWELLTRGINPYPTVDNWEILRYLKEDRRLDQPRHCPDEMYRIMRRCWNWDTNLRPSFGELTIEIPELLSRLEQSSGDKGKGLNIETTYVNCMANGCQT